MDTKKLFHVLVVGGGIVASNALNAEQLAFCDAANDNVCTINEDGESVPQEGIVCCWGTTCDVESK